MNDHTDDPTLPAPTGYEWPRLVPEMPEPEEMLPLLVDTGAERYVDSLRLLVAVLLVLAFVLPSGIVLFFAGKWFACVLLAVVLVLAAAAVSVVADSVES